MPRMKKAALTAVMCLTLSLSAAPASAASYVDKRARACTSSSCATGTVVEYWYKKGSSLRGVGWVYAGTTKKPGAQYARWLYKKPGGKTRVGKSWRKAKPLGDQVYTEWGSGGHTGPKLPRGTLVCTEYKDTARSCVTLK
ncbi:hypothetical protein WDH52_22915 [Streptomyces sp. TRM70308]|uniref:hypothetical protein n=1 Tax=Streptomyces sp. TRM70308 TaxID=3131932 RepID=UPI003D076FEC